MVSVYHVILQDHVIKVLFELINRSPSLVSNHLTKFSGDMNCSGGDFSSPRGLAWPRDQWV